MVSQPSTSRTCIVTILSAVRRSCVYLACIDSFRVLLLLLCVAIPLLCCTYSSCYSSSTAGWPTLLLRFVESHSSVIFLFILTRVLFNAPFGNTDCRIYVLDLPTVIHPRSLRAWAEPRRASGPPRWTPLRNVCNYCYIINNRASATNRYSCSPWAKIRYILKPSKKHPTSGVFGPWKSVEKTLAPE